MEKYIYRNENGSLIKGYRFNIILYQRQEYYLINLNVYADGYIDCLGELTIDELKSLLLKGTLTFKLPKASKLFIPYIGFIWDSTGDYQAEYDIEKFITLVKKKIKSLNEVDLGSECIDLFRDYLVEPSADNLSKLKETFFLLPEDRRALFEIADYKDPLLAFMKTGKEFTREQREYMLNDYFDGEWIELK